MEQSLIVRVVSGHHTVQSAMVELQRVTEESVRKFQAENGATRMVSSSHHWGYENDKITATVNVLIETC